MGLFDKKSKFAIPKKYILSEESAMEIIMKLFTLYDFDIEGEKDEDTKKLKEKTAENLLESIRLGDIELSENGTTIIQHLKYPMGEVSTIEYQKVKGKHKRAMDEFASQKLYSRGFAMLGSVSSLGIEAFDKLDKYDSDTAEGLGILFLL